MSAPFSSSRRTPVPLHAAVLAHHTGKKRLAHGRRRNFAQRHPILTGVAAGAVAHHMGKKHR